MAVKPKMLLISFSQIVADARVLKQVERFSQRFALTTVGYGEAPAGAEGHVRIPDSFPIWRYSRPLVLTRQYTRAYWANAAIAHASAELAGTQWDVVFANDVDAAGLALAQDSRCGVHVDLHEYAPRQNEDSPRWRLFVAPFIRWMCRRFVRRATSVSTVAPGLADAYRSEFGIIADVVTNAAPFYECAAGPVSVPLRLVHSGAGLSNRQLELMVEAAEGARVPVLMDFYLTRNDPAYVDRLRERVASSERVRILDPVPYADLVRTLSDYDVGVFVLPPLTFNYRHALPNKLFDFVQARLGVVVGPSPEMARYVREYGFGVVAEDFTVEALRNVIESLTVESVQEYKLAADASALELSGEHQVDRWEQIIDTMIDTAEAKA